MKKFISAAMAIMLSAALLAGCRNQPMDNNSQSPQDSNNGIVDQIPNDEERIRGRYPSTIME